MPEKPVFNRREITELSRQLMRVMLHDKTIELLDEIHAAPENERMDVARQLASLPQLKERGVPISNFTRLTTRVFEDPQKPVPTIGSVVAAPDVGPGTAAGVCLSLGYFVCLSAGADTITLPIIPVPGAPGTEDPDPTGTGGDTGDDDTGTGD